jgi:hypothetical protein
MVDRVDTTTDGVPISTDDVAVFDLSVSDEILGRALVDAIGRAQGGVRPLRTDEWQAALEPLLRAAGVSSWRAFVRGCRDVSVFSDVGVVRLVPSINLGSKEGFEGLEDRQLTANVKDIAHVGQMAKRALEVAIPNST